MRFELADLKREYKSDMEGVDVKNDAFWGANEGVLNY
jgi:hypothetical protein